MIRYRLASLNLPLPSLRFFCGLCIFLQCQAETLIAQDADESASNRRTMVVQMRTESGDPIQEAEVRFVGRIAENRINQTIQANADGRVTLEFEEGQVDSLWFTAQSDGRVPIHYVWRSDHSEIKLPEKVEIELVSGSTMEGQGVVSKILIVENGQYTTYISGWQQTFEVEPGKLTEVNLGGTGSRVGGSFVLDRSPPSSLKWKFAPYVELQKLPREWPCIKYPGRVTEDSSFVIDDVPDGEYEVDFEVQALGEMNQIAGTLGRLRDKVVVNSKQSTDGEEGQISLGGLTITLDDTLEVGEVIPRFVAETLEGLFLRDRDLTGKLVLIIFWSSYSDASANETATMAKLSEELEGYFQRLRHRYVGSNSGWQSQATGDRPTVVHIKGKHRRPTMGHNGRRVTPDQWHWNI